MLCFCATSHDWVRGLTKKQTNLIFSFSLVRSACRIQAQAILTLQLPPRVGVFFVAAATPVQAREFLKVFAWLALRVCFDTFLQLPDVRMDRQSLLLDPTQTLQRSALKLHSGWFRSIVLPLLSPEGIRKHGVAAAIAGLRIGSAQRHLVTSSVLQGGSFVFSRHADTCLYAHREAHPVDHAPVEEVLAALDVSSDGVSAATHYSDTTTRWLSALESPSSRRLHAVLVVLAVLLLLCVARVVLNGF